MDARRRAVMRQSGPKPAPLEEPMKHYIDIAAALLIGAASPYILVYGMIILAGGR